MRKTITKEKLKQLYFTNTNEALCKILGVSKVTLIRMIDDAGIEKKGKGYAQKYLLV